MANNSQYSSNIFGEDLAAADNNTEETIFDDMEVYTNEKKKKLSRQKGTSRYDKIINHIFSSKYKEGATKIRFERDELNDAADELKIKRIDNLGDINYHYRYRGDLPESIRSKAPKGLAWIIRPAGIGIYSIELIEESLANINPQSGYAETKIPDATPGIVAMYAKGDEQALLTKLRYNRLIDIFTGVTCYSLQNHLRTTVPDMGQVETDEIYIGIDKKGSHYVFPLQAKGGTDKLGIVQIEQDYALCKHKFPDHVQCRPIAAQFMDHDVIALFEFENTSTGMKKLNEKHYRLVSPDKMTEDDLRAYMLRSE